MRRRTCLLGRCTKSVHWLLQIINDPVHGNYRLDPVTVDIIDSRHFQRLRRLKQLGMAYYVRR